MRNIISILCAAIALFMVGCAAQQAAQDQSSIQRMDMKGER